MPCPAARPEMGAFRASRRTAVALLDRALYERAHVAVAAAGIVPPRGPGRPPRLARAAALYLVHVEGGLPLLRAAVAAGVEWRNAHRDVSRIEDGRDDRAFDRLMDALGSKMGRAA